MDKKYYVVERAHSLVQNVTKIFAGPFDDVEEAEAVADANDLGENSWFDVWDDGVLRERGYLND